MNKGHMLNDRYKIIKKIGGGGMANVFLARDTILDRDVAVKALRMEYANDQEFITRFDREAQSASSLSHPNIVNIYDVGGEDHVMYIVMEYVDGMTLKEYIQHHGSIEVTEAVDIMRQLTSAIAHAHDNDIVHRDIKPQNILIDQSGQIKVTDFGIAVALSATSLTQTNSILGSVHYLSPEQARGGMATKKSDIYSIGIVLFELLTGKIPFSGQSPVSIALKHLQSNTPSVRRYNQDIPQSVENIVLKATAKDPFHRYQSIYEMEDALATALDPDKINEEIYEPPVEAGDETKAIPIITDNQIADNLDQHTIVHQTNGATKNFPEESNDKEAVNKTEKKEKKPKKEKKKRKKWPIIVTIIILLLLAGAAALFYIPGLIQPKDIPVPDVIGMESDEAKDTLEEKKFVVEDEMVYSDEVEVGHVVKTTPGADRIAKEGSTVTIFISQGKEKVTIHDYVGRDFSQVKRILEEADYSEVIDIPKYSNRPEGEILDQIQPTPESEVIPSETKVIFEVSMGPEPISLNNLTGMTQEDAKAYLDSKNLKMNVIEENSETVSVGMVIRQSPTTGTEVYAGDTVDVRLSIGPEEKPPASHTITYTVPYKPATPEEPEEGQQENPEETQEQEEPVEQIVKIYIGDINNDITNVYREIPITEDTPVTFTLSIAAGSEAEYVITRDDEEIVRDTVSYEDGE